MSASQASRIARLFACALCTCSVGFVALFLVIAVLRISYPFELEWMEGGTVDHVRRILDGKPLYVPPSLDFVPYLYTPLYFYVSAAVAKVTGIGFFPLRLVSLTAALGSVVLIAVFIRRHSRSSVAAIAGAGLFAATYALSGSWLDIARVDSLFLVFLLAAVYLVARRGSHATYLLAGLMLALSFLCKQSALVLLAPLALYLLAVDWKRALYFVASAGGLIIASSLALNHLHQGWYRYYVLDVPRSHNTIRRMYVDFWTEDLLRNLPLVCLVAAGFFLVRRSRTQVRSSSHAARRPRREPPAVRSALSPEGPGGPAQVGSMTASSVQNPEKSRRESLVRGERPRMSRPFLALLGVGMLGCSWLGRLHAGGGFNVLLPAYAFLAIAFGCALAVFQERLGPKLRAGLYAIGVLQFLLLIYDPAAQVPKESDRLAGHEFIDKMARLEGEIYVPSHGYLPLLAGKRPLAHEAAIADLVNHGGGEPARRLADEFLRAVRSHRFAAIIMDDTGIPWFEKFYVTSGRIFDNDSVFFPVTGRHSRPELLLTPVPP
ncbi:MAG: glycosyltransferase family 39 protein [Planctomycetota bacterium]